MITHIEKQDVELAIASPTTTIMNKANSTFLGPQNGPTFCEHVIYKAFTLF
jgi:hypothetical protein